MLLSTSATKSVALISASRVMSHAAPQHSARASESSRVARAADHGARASAHVEADLAAGEVTPVEQQRVGLPLPDQLGDLGQLAAHVGLGETCGGPGGRPFKAS